MSIPVRVITSGKNAYVLCNNSQESGFLSARRINNFLCYVRGTNMRFRLILIVIFRSNIINVNDVDPYLIRRWCNFLSGSFPSVIGRFEWKDFMTIVSAERETNLLGASVIPFLVNRYFLGDR